MGTRAWDVIRGITCPTFVLGDELSYYPIVFALITSTARSTLMVCMFTRCAFILTKPLQESTRDSSGGLAATMGLGETSFCWRFLLLMYEPIVD